MSTELPRSLIDARTHGSVLYVTLQRPEKRNALSRALIAAIAETFSKWRDEPAISLAVLSGAGDKAFASGGDLAELDSLRTEAGALEFANSTCAALDCIRYFPVPVLAVLNGDALGGGAELALACDLRIACPHARIGFLQGQLNISTAWGGGADLFNLLGSSKAFQILCTADVLGAERAREIGLVDWVASASDTSGSVAALIAQLAARKAHVMRAFKSLGIMRRSGTCFDEMARQERSEFARTWTHPDHWEAVAAFMNRPKASKAASDHDASRGAAS